MATTIKHVQGNMLRVCIPLTLRVVTMEDGVVTETDNDFIPNTDYPVRVIFDKGNKYPFEATMTGNVACVTDAGSLPIGVYSVTVLCRNDDGEPMRFKQDTVLNIVDTTAEAGIEPGVEYQAETHYLDAAVFWALGGGGGSLPAGVVIDPDYVHTDNNFTDEYKEMLDNGGGSVTIDSTPVSGSGNAVSSGGVYTALAGKANSSHTHNIADVTGLQSALDGKQATLTSSTALGGVNGKTLNYGGAVSLTGGDIPLSAGSSTNVSGAISLINNNLGQKQDALTFGTGLTLNGNIVTVDTAAAVASGDTGYTTGAQVATALAGKANASHTHAIADVTGLQSVLNDLQNDKQDELVSGTSIKTINGESVLGSGNISADTVVSVTETTNGQITSYTSDMTPAEVRTALTAGKEVVYKVSSASGTSYSYYQVVSYNLVGITATKINGTASETLVHTSSGVSVSSTTLATSTDVSGKQDAIASGTATIAVSDWSSNSCTVTATGVTASNTVIVSPDSASITDYAAAGVQCTAQGANTLTFTCTTTPTSSLTINYLAL